MDKSKLLKTKSTTFDKIAAFYMDATGAVKLTPKQDELRKRWESAYSIFCQWGETSEDQKDMVEMFQALHKNDDGEELSRAQAYRDIRNAINLFGDVNKNTKEGIRNIINQTVFKGIQMAISTKDLDNLSRLLSVLVKNNGTDKDDPDLPDLSKIQPNLQVIKIENNFIEKYAHILPAEYLKHAKSHQFETAEIIEEK